MDLQHVCHPASSLVNEINESLGHAHYIVDENRIFNFSESMLQPDLTSRKEARAGWKDPRVRIGRKNAEATADDDRMQREAELTVGTCTCVLRC